VILGQEASAQEQNTVRAVLFFSPTCPHCHQVINEDLPVIFDVHGGPPQVWYDQTIPPEERAFYFITNGQVELLLVDASKPDGNPLYAQSTTGFEIPQSRSGVPRLIAGDSVLVGSVEIPQVFPRMIQEGLAGDGLDWPAIEGLESAISAIPQPEDELAQVDDTTTERTAEGQVDSVAEPEPETPTDSAPALEPAADTPPVPSVEQPETVQEPTEQPDHAGVPVEVAADSVDSSAAIPSESPTAPTRPAQATLEDIPVGRASMFDMFRQDPVGNTVSVVVLVLMILSVLLVGRFAPEWTDRKQFGMLIPALAVVGVFVAGYLTYVETSGTLAVCGPVGDCNAVQQSPYARLFGLVPVGLLGLVSYVVVFAAWLVALKQQGSAADWARLVILAIAFIGTVFSIYLTFLEPFVIGATCLWCLTSSVVITALLWLAAGPGTAAWSRITSAAQPPASGTP
jgi:uncharacterized membrane protein